MGAHAGLCTSRGGGAKTSRSGEVGCTDHVGTRWSGGIATSRSRGGLTTSRGGGATDRHAPGHTARHAHGFEFHKSCAKKALSKSTLEQRGRNIIAQAQASNACAETSTSAA